MRFLLMSLMLLFAGLFVGCGERSVSPAAKSADSRVSAARQENAFLAALKKDPRDLDALIGLGNLKMDAEQYGEAVEEYQKALAIQPENVEVRVDLGTCYRALGNYERAVEEYGRGLSFEPDHANALIYQGVVYAYDLKDKERALTAWEKYLEQGSTSVIAEKIKQEVIKLKSGKDLSP